MADVIKKFFVMSVILWIAPLAIIFGFHYHIFPGSDRLPPSTHTLLSGFLAVLSVNLVIALYIVMAMKEPPSGHLPEPDPDFIADARASLSRFSPMGPHEEGVVDSQSHKKAE